MTPMDTKALKPCPFCGAAEPIINEIEPHNHHFVDMPDYPGSFTVECAGCDIGVIRSTKDEAIEAWNRRAALSQPAAPDHVGLVERLEHVALLQSGTLVENTIREAIAALSRVQEPVGDAIREQAFHVDLGLSCNQDVTEATKNLVRLIFATPPAQGDAAQPGADAWKRSDYVVYDSGFGPINARVIGYVEGWVDLVFRDGSTAICRPSRISASPAAGGGGTGTLTARF